MAANNKKRGVIYIEKNGLYYFDENQTNILQFPFPPNLVQDLEIFDNDALSNQIKIFVQTNKILPCTLLFVVSNNIIFEKVVPVADYSKKDQEVQTFLENIPFENVISKVYDQDKGYRVIAFNKDIYTVLRSSFESMQFNVSGIIPNFILGNMGSSGALQVNSVKYILEKFDTLVKQDLLPAPVKPSILDKDILGSPSDSEENPGVKKKNTLPFLLPVLFILFLVLGFVIYQEFKPSAKPSPVPQTITAPTTLPTEIPTLKPTLISTPSATPAKK